MSKRFIKIMSLFKLANEELLNQGILIDKKKFFDAMKGVGPKKPVGVPTVTAPGDVPTVTA